MSNRLLSILLVVIAVAGVALAIGSAWLDDSTSTLEAFREIGGGIIAGAIVGLVLHLMAERAEER